MTAWIETFTGKRFDILAPRPEQICIEDIAHALSQQCRFTGHTRCFYSVAEHSIHVAARCENKLAGLLHDASEAYLSDLARPVKQLTALGPVYKQIEDVIQGAIYERYGIPMPIPADVKKWDNILLFTEKAQLMTALPWTDDASSNTLLESAADIHLDCFDPRKAEEYFLTWFYSLIKEKKVKRLNSAFDVHWPKTHRPTMEALLDFNTATKPDVLVLGGDQFDNACISHHNKSKPFYRPRAAYKNDERTFEAQFLTPLEKSLPKGCQKVWILGNHDDWEFQMVEQHPELEGLIDRVASLGLVERGWTVIQVGCAFRYGKLNYLHGEWLTGFGNQGPSYPSKKLVDTYAGNAVAGHTHAPQCFTRVSPINQTQKHMAWISPILGSLNPEYLRNRPSAWVNGFNTTEFMDGGNFNHYPIITTGGKCCFGGVEYPRVR